MNRQSLVITGLLFISVSVFGQGVEPVPSDKAVVYFARPSSFGFAINFSYFDSTRLIGIFDGHKYIRYECQPGRHLFWARSENKDFVEAELEAGKVYFIEAIVQMGLIKAGVELKPVLPDDKERVKRVVKLINERPSSSLSVQHLNSEATRLSNVIERGMKQYAELKSQNKLIVQLSKEMYHDNY